MNHDQEMQKLAGRLQYYQRQFQLAKKRLGNNPQNELLEKELEYYRGKRDAAKEYLRNFLTRKD
jgi:hypothetical protein